MSASLKMARMARNGRRPSAAIVRGDPGLFGAIGSALTGLITGGPAGAVAGAVSGWKGEPAAPRPTISASIPQLTTPSSFPSYVPTPGVVGSAQRFLPGGETGYTAAAKPAGYHLNKSEYVLKDGTVVPKGSRYVKNRRRNAMNPRALRRAVERVDAAKTWQSKLHEIETGKYTKAGNQKSCG